MHLHRVGEPRHRVVEDRREVRLHRDAAVVAAPHEVRDDALHVALALAGVGVVHAAVDPVAVLDVDVGDVVLHGVVELPRALARPGLGLGPVGQHHGVAGVEDELQAGDVVQHVERVAPAAAGVVHAVLVQRLQAGVEEHPDDGLQALPAPLAHLVLRRTALEHLPAHDADHLRPEALHARDRAARLLEVLLEVGVALDRLAPVGDGRAEAVHVHAGLVEGGGGAVERLVGEVVDVDAVDAAGLDVAPAELLGGGDLAREVAGGFVGESGEVHVRLGGSVVRWLGGWAVGRFGGYFFGPNLSQRPSSRIARTMAGTIQAQ